MEYAVKEFLCRKLAHVEISDVFAWVKKATAETEKSYRNFLGISRVKPISEWPQVVGHHRDSGLLDESNYETAKKLFQKIDPKEVFWVEENYGHWAVGWIEVIRIFPFTRKGKLNLVAKMACAISAAIEDYPVLDEDDWSRRERDLAFYWVKDGVRRLLKNDDKDLDDVSSEVSSWVGEHHPEEEESPEDHAVSEEVIAEALLALGYEIESE